jgi:NitT/TauT family transport system ATP-binding protein
VSETPAAPAVELRDLWMTFPGKPGVEPIQVLERVNLEVRRGEFVCIVGPSGCGKSTVLNIVAGFLSHTWGHVVVEGRPVHGPDPQRIFVFQENGVFPWLTVTDNIGFGIRPGDPRRPEIIRHYVEMVGLTGFEHAYPRELSGGMRQRVEIACALAPNPRSLHGRAVRRARLPRLLRCARPRPIWQEERKTVLFVTHDIEEAVQLADRDRDDPAPGDRAGGRDHRPAETARPGFAGLPRRPRPHLRVHGSERAGGQLGTSIEGSVNENEVLRWLERRGTRRSVLGLARYGIVAPRAFGVPVGTLATTRAGISSSSEARTTSATS